MSNISGYCEKCGEWRKEWCSGFHQDCRKILMGKIESQQQEIEGWRSRYEVGYGIEEIEETRKQLIKAILQSEPCTNFCIYGYWEQGYPDCKLDWCKNKEKFILDKEKLKKESEGE